VVLNDLHHRAERENKKKPNVKPPTWRAKCRSESAFIPFVSFGDLDNNTFKGLTNLLSVEQGIQYDEHT
jgi:hypothetical protein